MEPLDPDLGIRDPAAFKAKIAKYEGNPGNCTALVQLGISNESLFASDETGDRFANLLRFVRDAGGPQWQERWHFKKLPKAAQERTRPLADEVWAEWWKLSDPK